MDVAATMAWGRDNNDSLQASVKVAAARRKA
jgi:hypothetical protein